MSNTIQAARDDQLRTYLIVVIFCSVEDGDVALVQGLARALEAVVNLVRDVQSSGACASERAPRTDAIRHDTDMINTADWT